MLENGKNGVWGNFKAVWPYYCMRQEPGLGAGQPDVVVQDRLGRPGLIELKRPEKIELNPNQWIWHEMWWDGRGKTVVVSCLQFRRGEAMRWHVFVPEFHPRRLLISLTPDPVDRKRMCDVVANALGLKI